MTEQQRYRVMVRSIEGNCLIGNTWYPNYVWSTWTVCEGSHAFQDAIKEAVPLQGYKSAVVVIPESDYVLFFAVR